MHQFTGANWMKMVVIISRWYLQMWMARLEGDRLIILNSCSHKLEPSNNNQY